MKNYDLSYKRPDYSDKAVMASSNNSVKKITDYPSLYIDSSENLPDLKVGDMVMVKCRVTRAGEEECECDGETKMKYTCTLDAHELSPMNNSKMSNSQKDDDDFEKGMKASEEKMKKKDEENGSSDDE